MPVARSGKTARKNVIALTISFILAAAAANPAFADEPHTFRIAAVDASTAVREFAQQTGLQIMASAATLDGKKLNPVAGEHTTEDALQILLAGTGLKHQYIGDRGVVIAPATPAAPSSPGGEAREREAADPNEGKAQKSSGFWSRFRQAQANETGREQAAANRELEDTAQSKKRIELEEIVVTGTHIRGVSPPGSPVLVFTRADIEQTGAASVGEFMRKVPQNFSLTDRETVRNNGASKFTDTNETFGASINLRGLGAGATLALLDGQRLAPSGVQGGFVDVSLIPLSAVERIEMLTDGASAIYGADAVGGVVNFILRRDFEGAETSLRYGDSTRGGGAEFIASQLFGMSWGGGNAMLVYEHANHDSIDATQRHFIPPIPAPTPGPFTIVPDDRRNSVLASSRQALAPNLEVFGRGFVSERDFAEDLAFFQGVSQTEGTAQGSGGTLGASWDVSSGWSLTGTVDYSVTKQLTRIILPPTPPADFSRKSDSSGIDIRLSGAVFDIRGLAARASLGISARQEGFDGATAISGDLDRKVNSAYGELFIPLLGEGASQRLDISVAGRIDDYDDFGSSGLKPKAGITWAPSANLGLRASWSRAFRAPLLTQMDTSSTLPSRYFVFRLPDPTSLTGSTATIFPVVPGNPDLGPERSTSFTVGADLTPDALPDFKVSLTWYDIDYQDRISTPPLTGGFFALFQQEAALSPFIDRTPDLALVNSFYAQPIFNPSQIPATEIQAIYDSRYQNISSTRTSGFDLSISDTIDTAAGSFAPSLNVNYISSLDAKAAATTPAAKLFDTPFTPVRFKARGGLSWTRAAVSAGLFVSYADGYENNLLTPAAEIDSWTTLDWQLRYQPADAAAPSAFLRGVSLVLNVQNLADSDPPRLSLPVVGQVQAIDLGYDATNASAMGRFISLQLARRW